MAHPLWVHRGVLRVAVAQLVLHSAGQRAAGFCGCLLGSFSLFGVKLTFSRMAGTMMACPEGMEQERTFHEALSRVSGWRIAGETLALLDHAGTTVAEFEASSMEEADSGYG